VIAIGVLVVGVLIVGAFIAFAAVKRRPGFEGLSLHDGMSVFISVVVLVASLTLIFGEWSQREPEVGLRNGWRDRGLLVEVSTSATGGRGWATPQTRSGAPQVSAYPQDQMPLRVLGTPVARFIWTTGACLTF
jgi:hypothetical protein